MNGSHFIDNQLRFPQGLEAALCLMLFIVIPLTSSATELLVEGKTAEIGVDVVYVKAGAGVAFVDRGRLYKGDLVKILSKGNLTNWVHIQSGRLKGYVPIKVIRFDTRGADDIADPNMIRRLKEYQYDEQGRRINRRGERVGSGETNRDHNTQHEMRNTQGADPVGLKVGLGIGRFERTFRSNAPIQSVLSQTQAQPIVITSVFEVNYSMGPNYILSGRLVDYRMGVTQLQTAVLNEGLPFDLENEGQLIDVAGLFKWTQTNLALLGGPVLSIQRHGFQDTAPISVFLTSVTTNLGIQTTLNAKISGAALSFTALYARAIHTSQTPLSSGNLRAGRLWSVRSMVKIPLTDSLSVLLEGLLSSEELDRLGDTTHIDTVTDPAMQLIYTASTEENRLSAVLIGIALDI